MPQPTIAAAACAPFGIPFIIYPHGSAIEYTVKRDERYRILAGEAISKAEGLIIGSNEVKQRILDLYPLKWDEINNKSVIIGVGVDTSSGLPPGTDRKRARDRRGCHSTLRGSSSAPGR